MPSASRQMRLALVGAGSVGTAIALLLQRSGHEVVGVGPAGRASSERAATLLGSPVLDAGEPIDVDLVLLGVPDAAIEEVASALAPRIGPAAVVVHFAGSLGLEPLHAVVDSDRGACALHPVQACPDVDSALRRLPGSAWGITCLEPFRLWAHRLVAEDLGGMPVDVAGGDRPLWHAAAVATSNGIAALLEVGESILGTIGVDHPEAVLGPLAAGTVGNAASGGGGGATLTGPIVRGEVGTVGRHLAQLRARAPELAESYREIAAVVMGAARRTGRIDAATERGMSELMDD